MRYTQQHNTLIGREEGMTTDGRGNGGIDGSSSLKPSQSQKRHLGRKKSSAKCVEKLIFKHKRKGKAIVYSLIYLEYK